uniref:Uncharacterized protein n=2 Tax=Oryza sativa subsp. japonica TaxID=39947 RepID=Q2R5K9_ORYSJ|nr:hypothetical protein LOC_Os11g24640 [Oryza sativa Japonica Group]ABA93134.1 hypothetical protein LOC_Os11g24640 [Oryza sativa Japonica Group]
MEEMQKLTSERGKWGFGGIPQLQDQTDWHARISSTFGPALKLSRSLRPLYSFTYIVRANTILAPSAKREFFINSGVRGGPEIAAAVVAASDANGWRKGTGPIDGPHLSVTRKGERGCGPAQQGGRAWAQKAD